MNDNSKKRADKKRVIIIFSLLLAALIILPLLNMIDLNKLLPEKEGDKDEKPELTTSTLGDHHFTEPDYNEDIMQDSDYLELNRSLFYTYENETFEVTDNPSEYGNDPVATFFKKYFDSAIAGDCKTFNSCYTEEYLEENGEKQFPPQKIYNMKVTCLRSAYLKDGDVSGNYKGYHVYDFDVSYNILDNNGKLRNDFLGDEGTKPLVFQVIEGDSEIKISSVSVYSAPLPEEEDNGSVLTLVIIIAAVLLLGGAVFALIFKKSKKTLPFDAKNSNREDNNSEAIN